MRVTHQKDSLNPIDITVREVGEVEDLRINDPGKYKLLKRINYTHPELAEKVLYYRDPKNFEEYCSLLRIRTKSRGLVPFRLKRAQKVFWNLIIKRAVDNNEPVREYVLKARQIGFSTLIEAIIYWSSSLFCNSFANIFAHDKTKSAEIFNMTKMFYKTTPEEFQATRKLSNRHELYFANPNEQGELGLESKILVDTADNVHIGAASTIQYAHLSEFARYEAVNKDIRLALATFFQAVPDLPGTMIFLETTAYGGGLGKDYWDDEDNGYHKLFVSWLAEDDYRENYKVAEDELLSDPESKFGDEKTLRFSVIEQLRVWYPEYSDDNSWYDEESLHRLAWRRKVINKQTMKDKDFFRQEYPTTPEEAFINSGQSIFNKEKLNAHLQYAEKIEKMGNYVNYTYMKPRNEKVQDLGKFIPAKDGELTIYEMPVDTKIYVVGADVGYGVSGGDFSVAQVLDENGNQVAIYRAIIAPEEFAYPLVALAALYKKAYINPEANAPGIALIVRIKDIGYYRMYQRESFSSSEPGNSKEFGFHTNARTKPMIISLLREAISFGTILLRHVETIKELFRYTLDKDGKLTAPPGFHDDCVMALALAIKILPDESRIAEMQHLIRPGTLEFLVREIDRQQTLSRQNLGSVTGF